MLKCFAVIGCVASVVLDPAQPVAQVPEVHVTVASRPPMEAVFLLANAAIPAGIEVREADDIRSPPLTVLDEVAGSKIAGPEFVEAFNTGRRDYQAEWIDGVVVIRPRVGRVVFLDAASVLGAPTAVVGTMQAMRTILSPLDPRLLGPVVGSAIGPEAGRGLTASIRLDGRGGRVLDTLNQIPVQAGGAWKVVTRGDDRGAAVVGFGYVYARGSSVRTRMPGTPGRAGGPQ